MKISLYLVVLLCFSTVSAFGAGTTHDIHPKQQKLAMLSKEVKQYETGDKDFTLMFREAAKYWDIPQEWTEAIAQAESRRHPWTLNIEGKGFYFETKEDALMAAQEALEAGKSFDTGIMQINNFWLKKYNIPLDAVLDPLANIYLGGFILKEEIKRHGLTPQALGAYHSPNPDRANNYATMVLGLLNQPKSAETPAPKVYAVPSKPEPKENSSSSVAVNFKSPMLVQSTKTAVESDNKLIATNNSDDKNMKVIARTSNDTETKELKIVTENNAE